MAAHDPDDLVRDFPEGAEDARPLPGFVGTSQKDGYVRLHRLADTSEYLEIAEGDVVHRSRVPAAAGVAVVDYSILWVKRNALIDHKTPVSFEPVDPATLLSGDITDEALVTASASGRPGRGPSQRLAAAGSSGQRSNTTLDCWHCCSVGLSGC